MTKDRTIGSRTEMTLHSMNADPFVQAAVWRIYCIAPDLLGPDPRARLDAAQESDHKEHL
jgi:hypothetical protein